MPDGQFTRRSGCCEGGSQVQHVPTQLALISGFLELFGCTAFAIGMLPHPGVQHFASPPCPYDVGHDEDGNLRSGVVTAPRRDS